MHTYLRMYTYIYIYYINIVNIKKFKAFCTCLRVVEDLFHPGESTNMCMALLCLSVELVAARTPDRRFCALNCTSYSIRKLCEHLLSLYPLATGFW